MTFRKTALLSPAVNAQQAPPTEESQIASFEQKFGQMAYQAFSSKFPDLVTHIVTFKILDSDLEIGTAVAAFIMEVGGEFIYVPAILADNQLKPFDIMYVKSRDIFLPLNPMWLEEVNKGTLTTLGEGTKLPDTVSTDVDIRNIMVPPTTGRYSYASADVSPYSRLRASASEPLGRRLSKMANMMAGGGGMSGMGGAPAGGAQGGGAPMGGGGAPPGGQAQMAGSGAVSEDNYNPEIWATFVEQFQRIHQLTPGSALDDGVLDLETMAKMYKSHMKTWEMAQNPALAMGNKSPGMQAQAQGAMNASAPVGAMGAQSLQGSAPPQGMAPVPQQKMANAATDAYKTWGNKLDNLTSLMGRGAAVGGGTGAVYAATDRDLGDVPGAALRGAVGGAVGAPVGKGLGRALAHDHPKHIRMDTGANIGSAVGGVGGGYLMARQLPTTLSDAVAPSEDELMSYMHQNPDKARFLMRQGSVNHDAALISMIKHAQAKTEHKHVLLDFLHAAPTNVKLGFAAVLDKHPRLLKLAADIYGPQKLVDALTPRKEKTASATSHRGGGLYVADENTTPSELKQSFGSAAPEAFNGIQVRGYAYKDTRKNLRTAVQVQHFHDFHDCRESGVYRLYNTRGVPKPALVIPEPTPLFEEARAYFPHNSNKVKRVKTRVDVSTHNSEAHAMSQHELDHPEPDVERSHKLNRLVIFEDGSYFESEALLGEQVTEVVFPNSSALYKRVMKDGKSEPAAGKGCFVHKRGAHYFATEPVELSNLATGSNKILRGKISQLGGWDDGYAFVMDPNSPMGRPMCLKGERLVVIPASWKWMPLTERANRHDFLSTPKGMSAVVIDSLNSMGSEEVVARDAGENQFAVNDDKTLDKKAALLKIATQFAVHARDAEAILKIASVEGVCRARVVTPEQYGQLNYSIKVANGTAVPQAPEMGAPPAMQAPPEAAAGSPVDQAFQETVDGIQQQVSNLQGQLNVLMMVQQRAQEISGGGAPMQDPAMGGQPPAQGGQQMMPWQQAQMAQQQGQGQPPQQGQQMQQDPAMQDPAMQDPSMQQDPAMQQQQQGPAIMATETPSSEQIAGQVNPEFLQSAGQFQDQGAFDAGAISSLAKNPSLKALGSQYSANLEDSVDDLGRTLLTLYMQESKLKEQLGDQSFVELETQLRDTFKGLGSLVLSLTHNTAMLEDAST